VGTAGGMAGGTYSDSRSIPEPAPICTERLESGPHNTDKDFKEQTLKAHIIL